MKKSFGLKEKFQNFQFLTDNLAKNQQHILHILIFQNILSIFFILRKKIGFFSGGGSIPLADADAKNTSFY